MREAIDVVGSAFGFGNVVVELTTIGPFSDMRPSRKAPWASGTRSRSPSSAIAGTQPAQGASLSSGRPLFVEADKKFPKAIALDTAFPCEESRGAEHRFTDEFVDRAVDDQGEQRLDIAIEHAT